MCCGAEVIVAMVVYVAIDVVNYQVQGWPLDPTGKEGDSPIFEPYTNAIVSKQEGLDSSSLHVDPPLPCHWHFHDFSFL